MLLHKICGFCANRIPALFWFNFGLIWILEI